MPLDLRLLIRHLSDNQIGDGGAAALPKSLGAVTSLESNLPGVSLDRDVY